MDGKVYSVDYHGKIHVIPLEEWIMKRKKYLKQKERSKSPMSQIMKYFRSEHLPTPLSDISSEIEEVAHTMNDLLPDCAEKSAGLRKLLEAKDCFVRAKLEE